MYKALKTAQASVNESLLKFADDIMQVVDTKGSVSAMDPCVPNYTSLLETIQKKQDEHFHLLVTEIRSLNQNMSNVANILMNQTMATSVIPNLQPRAQDSDLKNVCVEAHVGPLDADGTEGMDDIEESDIEVDDDDLDVDVEATGEATGEATEPPKTPQTPDAEELEEDEGVEVEEWTYKGRLFFKDSENTVYANTGGEIGDAIGQYDPVKNIVKKLATN